MADLFSLKEALAMDPYFVGGSAMREVQPKWGTGSKDILGAALYGLFSGGLQGYGISRAKRQEEDFYSGLRNALASESPNYTALADEFPSARNYLIERELEDRELERQNRMKLENYANQQILRTSADLQKEQALQEAGLKAKPGAAIAARDRSRQDRNELAIYKADTKLIESYVKAKEIPPAETVERWKAAAKKFGVQVPTAKVGDDKIAEGTAKELKTSLLPEDVMPEETIQMASNEILPSVYSPREQELLFGGIIGGAGDLGEVPEGVPAEFAGLWGTGKKKKGDEASIGEDMVDAAKRSLKLAGVPKSDIDKVTADTTEAQLKLLKSSGYDPIKFPKINVSEFTFRPSEPLPSAQANIVRKWAKADNQMWDAFEQMEDIIKRNKGTVPKAGEDRNLYSALYSKVFAGLRTIDETGMRLEPAEVDLIKSQLPASFWTDPKRALLNSLTGASSLSEIRKAKAAAGLSRRAVIKAYTLEEMGAKEGGRVETKIISRGGKQYEVEYDRVTRRIIAPPTLLE